MGTNADTRGPDAVLEFWFQEIEPAAHWRKDPKFDALISERFGALHQAASRCECVAWRNSAAGRLAEVIVLDQFSRNIFRDQGASFAQDSLALALAQEAVSAGALADLTLDQQKFLLMPYMHSESRLIHEQAVRLFVELGDESTLRFEHRHKEIIDRFGRYPHRNAILGRVSSAEELEFLQQPGSAF